MSLFTSQYANTASKYRGRFAPSPTGPLHLGSLLTAVASYLDAQYHQGEWIIRIEDVDTTRALAGASESILFSLKQHGLHSDLPIMYQSQRRQRYETLLTSLQQQQQTFECYCSRKQLVPYQQQHPSNCVISGADATGTPSIRFRVDEQRIGFNDRLQGQQPCVSLLTKGPFVLKRRDQLFAYQLAVVADDADQGITDVVRGIDIMPLTSQQIALQQALGLPTPRYLHLPLVCNPQGQKLSKQNHAQGINPHTPIENILKILELLRVDIPESDLYLTQTPEQLLKTALPYWHPHHLPLTLAF
jgi:glutamyl-Q tRNA(Asp) synthetase